MGEDRALVVGAGPVGLAAALFLARAGRMPRVVEMRTEPSTHSKALAINPRTLDLLEPTGVTDTLLSLGEPMRGAEFHTGRGASVRVSFDGIHPRYPFMLALSQATTERTLEQALVEAGGSVERGVKLTACRASGDRVECDLEDTRGSSSQTVSVPWVVAADGAHSTVRHSMGVEFPGRKMARPWYLADAPVRTALSPDRAHAFLLPGGAFVFLIRVVDPFLAGVGPAPIWRVIANRPDPLSRLVQADQAGEAIWESEFGVSHRVCRTFAKGGAYFAGDACSIHSPIGARGMNLGIEDAWLLANLAATGNLARYDALRRPLDRGIVRRIEAVSRVIACDPGWLGLVRRAVLPLAIRVAWLRGGFVRTATGLDHPMPEINPS